MESRSLLNFHGIQSIDLNPNFQGRFKVGSRARSNILISAAVRHSPRLIENRKLECFLCRSMAHLASQFALELQLYLMGTFIYFPRPSLPMDRLKWKL